MNATQSFTVFSPLQPTQHSPQTSASDSPESHPSSHPQDHPTVFKAPYPQFPADQLALFNPFDWEGLNDEERVMLAGVCSRHTAFEIDVWYAECRSLELAAAAESQRRGVDSWKERLCNDRAQLAQVLQVARQRNAWGMQSLHPSVNVSHPGSGADGAADYADYFGAAKS